MNIINFILSLVGVFPLIAMIRLTSELSTAFINLRWYLHAFNLKDTKLYLYNGFIILVTFGLTRIVTLFPIWYLLYSAPNDYKWRQVDIEYKIFVIVASLGLDSLNIYWYYRILVGSLKHLSNKKTVIKMK
jgi:hypothetical protein